MLLDGFARIYLRVNLSEKNQPKHGKLPYIMGNLQKVKRSKFKILTQVEEFRKPGGFVSKSSGGFSGSIYSGPVCLASGIIGKFSLFLTQTLKGFLSKPLNL